MKLMNVWGDVPDASSETRKLTHTVHMTHTAVGRTKGVVSMGATAISSGKNGESSELKSVAMSDERSVPLNARIICT